MSKPTTPASRTMLLDKDSIGMVAFDDLRDHPPLIVPDSTPALNLLDAGLTRVSRVQIILRALEMETESGDQSVLYGHLSAMLAEAFELLTEVSLRQEGES